MNVRLHSDLQRRSIWSCISECIAQLHSIDAIYRYANVHSYYVYIPQFYGNVIVNAVTLISWIILHSPTE